jgi:hypothetical protein
VVFMVCYCDTFCFNDFDFSSFTQVSLTKRLYGFKVQDAMI